MKRALLAVVLPGLATFAAWQITFGRIEPDSYSVAEGASAVLAMLVIGVVTGWLVRWDRKSEVWLACASAVAGTSKACWMDWSDDTTGLFVVGWFMVTTGMAIGSYLVIGGIAWYREPRRTDRQDA